MPKEIQRKLIRKGWQYLEDLFGVRVRVYVPPWNRLALNTAEVLREEDFHLSGGNPDPNFDLCQIPCVTSIKETTCVMNIARRFSKGVAIVGTILHDYDFLESKFEILGLSMSQFEELLRQWKKMFHAETKLLAAMILDDRKSEAEKVRANFALSKAIRYSKIGCRILPRFRDIYWDTETALRFAKVIKILP